LAGATISPSYAANDGQIYIVQGLPDKDVDVAIDGKSVAAGVKTGSTPGPFMVKPGTRTVTFSQGGTTVFQKQFKIKARSKADVVVHLPASASGDPLLTVFKYDKVKVPKGKAVLEIGQAGVVPPADVRLDNQLFSKNIANTEFAREPVPATTYKVSLVPTGAKDPVLFSTNLPVNGGLLNLAYFVGDAQMKTMTVAKHDVAVATTGTGRPRLIPTGTGGQAVGAGPSMEVNLAR
jgi:hypothetical protein